MACSLSSLSSSLHLVSQALINVVDAMLSQRTMGADTALHALDALATAALCPLVRAQGRAAGQKA